MNHHMSSRQRKNVSSNGNMKKMQNVRNCSTHSIIASHRFSNLAKHIPKCGLDLTSPSMVLSPQLLQGLAIIMGNLVGPLEGQADTHLVETLVVDTTIQIGVVKGVEVGTVAAHILHKGEAGHMVLVACLVQVLGVEVVVME